MHTPIDAAIVVVLLFLPLHYAILRELDKLADPAYLRSQGVVLRSPGVLEECARPIGRYRNQEVWESVTFMGMHYRFHRIVPPEERERIGAGELYVEPGLVYVTD